MSALGFLNAFFAGLLGGMEIAIHHGLRAPSATLDDRAQLQLRQALVRRLRILVPAFFLPTIASGLALAALERGWLRGVALCALLIWVVIRVIGTVPINSATLTWKLEAPPENWKAQIARAERFHEVGVWAVIVAFGCALAALP